MIESEIAKITAAIAINVRRQFRHRLRQAMLTSNTTDYLSNSFNEKMLFGIFLSNVASSILISVE